MRNFVRYLDILVLEFFEKTYRPKWLDRIFVFFTKLWDYGFVWFSLVIILYLFDQKYTHISLLLLTSILSVIVFSEWLFKFLVRRRRPFEKYDHIVPNIKKPRSFSFPSGHTAMSFAAVMVISWLQNLYLTGAILFVAIMISFSRIYLRVHYPSDVIVGILVGVTIGWWICMLF